MAHWALDYIGSPWAPDADGPEHFACWGLVRHVFRTRHRVELPHVVIRDGAIDEAVLVNVRAIKQAVQTTGWRQVPAGERPLEDDVVVMRSAVRLHVGVVIRANGSLGVMHSEHACGVVFQRWADATDGMTTELWRRSA